MLGALQIDFGLSFHFPCCQWATASEVLSCWQSLNCLFPFEECWTNTLVDSTPVTSRWLPLARLFFAFFFPCFCCFDLLFFSSMECFLNFDISLFSVDTSSFPIWLVPFDRKLKWTLKFKICKSTNQLAISFVLPSKFFVWWKIYTSVWLIFFVSTSCWEFSRTCQNFLLTNILDRDLWFVNQSFFCAGEKLAVSRALKIYTCTSSWHTSYSFRCETQPYRRCTQNDTQKFFKTLQTLSFIKSFNLVTSSPLGKNTA